MAEEKRVAGTEEKGGLGPSPNSDPATATKDPNAKPKPAKRAARSSDPDQIAADIERTREELAETLDAIAEKVSPKRVAKRTTKKVTDAVKETAHDAKEKVTGGHQPKSDWAPDPGPAPVAAVAAATPSYATTPATYASSGPTVKPEYVAAGVAAAVLAFLLLRKRR